MQFALANRGSWSIFQGFQSKELVLKSQRGAAAAKLDAVRTGECWMQ